MSTKTQFLGLAGPMWCGKSSIALLVAAERRGTIIPFAQALKDLAKDLGWNGVKDETGRKLLQLLGTDVCRDCIDENYWVDEWKLYVDNEIKNTPLIIADDVRFPNEIQAIRDMGGKVLWVQRDGTGLDSLHPSETSINYPDCDGIVLNQTGHLDLAVSAVLKELSDG